MQTSDKQKTTNHLKDQEKRDISTWQSNISKYKIET